MFVVMICGNIFPGFFPRQEKTAPCKARLLLSVPPEVKIISSGLALRISATPLRAVCSFFCASLPSAWTELGLAETEAAESKYIIFDFRMKIVYIIQI